MTDDKLTALAARLRDHAAMHESIVPHDDEQRQWRDDLIAAAEYLRQCAEAEPTIDINIKRSWSYAAPKAMNTQADAIESLREVARIAHDGGGNLGFGEALVAIRKLTLPFWTRRAVLAAQGGKDE